MSEGPALFICCSEEEAETIRQAARAERRSKSIQKFCQYSEQISQELSAGVASSEQPNGPATPVGACRPEQGAPDWRSDIPGRPLSEQEISDVVAWLAAA